LENREEEIKRRRKGSDGKRQRGEKRRPEIHKKSQRQVQWQKVVGTKVNVQSFIILAHEELPRLD
jgi:hypothetical protein